MTNRTKSPFDFCDLAEVSDSPDARWTIGEDEAVTAIIAGERVAQTREEALRLVQVRFGCVLPWLSPEFQTDPEIAAIASRLSNGKVFNRTHSHVPFVHPPQKEAA